ncbi:MULTISPECIES: helix-turn-helix domain-containing protein [Cyanophyceae]|uniref:Helix-turn-helix domain-containing protein n=1 Tax=Leptolyngbya subtilissima DQ-A4 TaxID=2933933 RepID=A0ABV0KBC1_9CYAN|nr:helix-turn-helix transcriptional regulator [Nodosilinea sp. FACHB-141]MBD2115122.1 helix-turn-helix transcriptional regulator [Nodosilinea sp. FACHB-141]
MALKLVSAFSLPGLPQRQPEVGHLIRHLRQLTGHTQEQFAGVLGVSFSTLNRWENGHMQPSPLALKQVNSVLVELAQISDPRLQAARQALLAKYMTVNQPGNGYFEGRHHREQA